jgi:Methyltransferase domain
MDGISRFHAYSMHHIGGGVWHGQKNGWGRGCLLPFKANPYRVDPKAIIRSKGANIACQGCRMPQRRSQSQASLLGRFRRAFSQPPSIEASKPPQTAIACRLCGGTAAFAFSKKVLRRHEVSFFKCQSCGSAQTEVPYWLDEAYAIPGVHVDVGIASRTIKNWVALATLFEDMGLPLDALVVDFGGASGLLARLLRDTGFNARSFDKYSTPAFTSYFNAEHPEASKPRVITAFEVFEHFVEPQQEIHALLSGRPDLVIFTTWFYDNHSDDWIYFAEDCGQHVFFYSQQALASFVEPYGYDLVLTSFFHVLVRRDASQALRDGLEAFRLDAQRRVYEKARPLFELIAFGNDHIEADYKKAEAWFKADLDAS